MTALSRPIEGDQPAASSSGQRPSRPRSRSWFARHDGVVAILVYLAISLFWYRSVVAHMNANCACGLRTDPGDGADYVWWFEWFVHALGHGLPLMHPTVIWSPTGINMFSTTASLLLAAIVAPITLIWSPIVSLNVVMILAPAVSGWAANRLCRYITRSPWPSLLAGATFGYSTFEIAHLVGHPQMAVALCPPLVALCVIRLLDSTLPARRFVIQVSVLLIAQVFLSIEAMFTMTVVGVLALAIFWLTGDREQRRELVGRLRVLTLPFLIAGLASSWYLVQVLGAPSYATGVGSLYPTDALGFFVPMPYTWIGGAAFSSISGGFVGGVDETTAYLGLPLLLILGRYLITRRHTRTAQVLAILMAVLVLWILGPILVVGGTAVARLPYTLVSGLPLLDETLQGRITVYLALAAAVALAIWLASPRRLTLVAWACAALALACVLPNLITPSDNNVTTWLNPSFFSTTMYRHYLRSGETVLPIRWGWSGEAFMWQAEDHMYWKMADGYWRFTPLPSWKNQLTDALWTNAPPRHGDGRLLKDLVVRRHVSDVVVQDNSLARWRQTIHEAGLRPTASVGGVTLYRVPPSWLTSTDPDHTASGGDHRT